MSHNYRIYATDQLAGLYTWKCSCGAEGAPDHLHPEYARDGWREHHGMEPQILRPLV